MDREQILNSAKEFTNDLAKLILLDDPDYRTELDEDELVVHINFPGENLGFMIGPHGKFLQSLQHVIAAHLRKIFPDDRIAVIVDAGDYLASKIARLEQYSLQKADDARMLGDSMDLEPMSAFERKMVHKILGKFDDIKTESFGEGDDRYVRITLITDEKLGLKAADVNLDENIQE